MTQQKMGLKQTDNKKIPQKNNHRFIKIIFYILMAVILSYIAYQYNIILFLVFALLPFWIIAKSKKIKPANKLRTCMILAIFICIFLNTLIIDIPKNITTVSEVGSLISNINILIISWTNFIIWGIFFYSILKPLFQRRSSNFFNNKYRIIVATIILNLLIMASLWKNIFDLKIVFFAFVFAIFYTILMKQVFSKSTNLIINFLIPLSISLTPIIGLFILLIRNSFDLVEHGRIGSVVGFTYLCYFQIISFSSLVFYFLSEDSFKQKNIILKRTSIILLIILLSGGVIFQNLYFRFLNF